VNFGAVSIAFAFFRLAWQQTRKLQAFC